MTEKQQQKPNDIELPQSIIESFARFLVPEIRKFYESEQGQKEFAEWQDTVKNKNVKKEKSGQGYT